MHRVSLQDFARMTGEPYLSVQERAERGDTIRNIDFSEYGVRDEYGDVQGVKIPDRLMVNLRPGLSSASSSVEAFEAGRVAERREGDQVGEASGAGQPPARTNAQLGPPLVDGQPPIGRAVGVAIGLSVDRPLSAALSALGRGFVKLFVPPVSTGP